MPTLELKKRNMNGGSAIDVERISVALSPTQYERAVAAEYVAFADMIFRNEGDQEKPSFFAIEVVNLI